MPTQVEEDAFNVLALVVGSQDDARAAGDASGFEGALEGSQIAEATGLPPGRINDAVAILRASGFLDGLDYLGTAPYNFGQVYPTALGRFEHQRSVACARSAAG